MGNLDKIKAEIHKKYGEGSIADFSSEGIKDIEAIPTGCIPLDKTLEIGGVPRGRIVEIYGQSGTGKTSLCVHIAAEAQKMGEMVAYMDLENAVSTKYFNSLGVDVLDSSKFMLCQSSSAEEALDILEMLVTSNEVGVVIIDSVAALLPLAEAEGEIADNTISLQARLLSKSMRRLSNLLAKSKTCVIFINQIRDNISSFGYGPKTTTPGGKALRFYSSLRIELATIGQIKEGEKQIGSKIKAKIVKSRISSPFKEVEYDIVFGEGISLERYLINEGVDKNIINKSGSWYNYGDIKLGQGSEKARLFLKNNKEVKEEIINKLKEAE